MAAEPSVITSGGGAARATAAGADTEWVIEVIELGRRGEGEMNFSRTVRGDKRNRTRGRAARRGGGSRRRGRFRATWSSSEMTSCPSRWAPGSERKTGVLAAKSSQRSRLLSADGSLTDRARAKESRERRGARTTTRTHKIVGELAQSAAMYRRTDRTAACCATVLDGAAGRRWHRREDRSRVRRRRSFCRIKTCSRARAEGRDGREPGNSRANNKNASET